MTTNKHQTAVNDAEIQTEEAYQAQVLRDLPRNYAACFAHGLLGQTGFFLVVAPTFVPAYIFLLSGSRLAVGMALAAQFIGSALSSIWGATLIEHRSRVMPVVYNIGWLMRIQVLGLALSAFFLTGGWALAAVCIFLFLFGFFSGIQGVSFNFLMSKVIPVSKRGSFAGMRNFLGGLTASGIAYLGGKYLVGNNVFGNGYATTFMLAFILTSIGITALTYVRESKSLGVRTRSSLLKRLSEVPAILRSDAQYTRFFIARALAALGTAAVPFYILYVGKYISLSGTNLGYLSLAFLLPQTVSNLFWGRVSDRHGYRLVFLLSVGLWGVSTVGLLMAGSLPLFLLAFCGLGIGFGGYQIASQNFVLEFGSRDELPMFIAVSDTASHVMMAIGPLLGGLIAYKFDFAYLFWFAIIVKGISMVAIWQVQEPRYRVVAASD